MGAITFFLVNLETPGHRSYSRMYVFTKTYNAHMSVSVMSYYLHKQLFKLQSVCFKEVIHKKLFGTFIGNTVFVIIYVVYNCKGKQK